ncbi:MAG: tetratricopeptide repeat protein [Acidobacteria bacterium]|nr:MAG: tetratricopeptide repeat protein [Acidobacteriota bacterium]
MLTSVAAAGAASQAPSPPPAVPTAAAPAAPTGGQPSSEAAAPAAPAATVEVTPLRGLAGRAAALLVSGQQGGQISVSMLVFPPGSAGKPGRVPWVLDVPGPTLASATTDGNLGLELAVYGMRGDKVVGSQVCAIRVAGAPAAWQTNGGLKFLGFVDTAPVPTSLRVLVREPVSGSFGMWEFPVPAVPGRGGSHGDLGFVAVAGGPGGQGAGTGTGPMGADATDAVIMRTPTLLAIVAPEPEDAWVVAGVGGEGASATAPPFSLAGDGNVPSTRPVLKPGTTVRLVLLGAQMPLHPVMSARLRRSDGRPEVSYGARLLTRLPAPAGEFERLVVVVTLPADLAAGEHELVLGSRAGTEPGEATAAIRFRVAPPEKAAAALVWSGVPVGEGGEMVATPVRPAGAAVSEDEPPANLKAAYRDAVAHVAADDSPASLRALVNLERAALGRGDVSEFNRLANTALGLGRTVRKTSSRALLGLCLVNLDLYREHSRDEARLAIAHSRRVVEQLAELLAGDSKDKEGQREAAEILAVFAGELQAVGSWSTSERLFARAQHVDPGDVGALMGRAGVYERASQPGEAIKMLDKVLAIRPDHREARLRLGVNQRRAGQLDAAQTSLTACTGAGNPDWVRAVAWQELASMRLAEGKVPEAVAMLRTATADVPADQHLQILLASALDRERHHREALAILNAVVGRPTGGPPSARFLYAEWPHEDLDAARVRLAALRPEAMAALAAAVKEDRP